MAKKIKTITLNPTQALADILKENNAKLREQISPIVNKSKPLSPKALAAQKFITNSRYFGCNKADITGLVSILIDEDISINNNPLQDIKNHMPMTVICHKAVTGGIGMVTKISKRENMIYIIQYDGQLEEWSFEEIDDLNFTVATDIQIEKFVKSYLQV